MRDHIGEQKRIFLERARHRLTFDNIFCDALVLAAVHQVFSRLGGDVQPFGQMHAAPDEEPQCAAKVG